MSECRLKFSYQINEGDSLISMTGVKDITVKVGDECFTGSGFVSSIDHGFGPKMKVNVEVMLIRPLTPTP